MKTWNKSEQGATFQAIEIVKVIKEKILTGQKCNLSLDEEMNEFIILATRAKKDII